LEAERKEITTVTQTVASIQADFDKYVVRFRAQETDNIKHQAKLLAAMSPLGAATLFAEMKDDVVVRILFTMKTDEASVILDTMSKLGKPDARRAAELTAQLQHVLPNSTNTASAAAP
jgi:flagellar motility protein MotE (MotC chaperone)